MWTMSLSCIKTFHINVWRKIKLPLTSVGSPLTLQFNGLMIVHSSKFFFLQKKNFYITYNISQFMDETIPDILHERVKDSYIIFKVSFTLHK